MKLINHIRLFIKNIVILDSCLSDYLTSYKIECLDKIFGILSSNLKEYNKLNKITKYKVKTPILLSNLYLKLQEEYSKIATGVIKDTYPPTLIKTLITNNHAKICEFNTTILKTIYYTINELLIANTVRNTKEIKESNIIISIPEHGSTSTPPKMVTTGIISINLKNLTFKYTNESYFNKIETSSFADLCTQKIEKTCFTPDDKESIIGLISKPPDIPLSGCSEKKKQTSNSFNSSTHTKKRLHNDNGDSFVAGLGILGNLASMAAAL